MSFYEENGCLVLLNILSKEMCEITHIQCKIIETLVCYDNNVSVSEIKLGDAQVNCSFSYYAPLYCESLSLYLKPIIENHIKKNYYLLIHICVFIIIVQHSKNILTG
jgi:hypothetical protein